MNETNADGPTDGEQILWNQLAERDEVNAQLRVRIAELERELSEHKDEWDRLEMTVEEAHAIRAEVEKLTKERDEAAARAEFNREALGRACQKCDSMEKERDEARVNYEAFRQLFECNPSALWSRLVEARKEINTLRAQLAEREEDRARLDHLENLIQHLPHTRFYWTDDPDEEMPVGFSITIEGCETSQIVGATLRECIDREMAYDEAAAIRAARAQPEDGK